MTLWAADSGLAWPSPSITQSLTICQPPARASTATTVWRRRMRTPLGAGAMKRTLLTPTFSTRSAPSMRSRSS
ncbi:hypothetical protein D3C73_571080 [compost metagenome]